jgi:arabinofuranosyltransferase
VGIVFDALRDLWSRHFAALQEAKWWFAVALPGVCLLALPPVRRVLAPRKTLAGYVLLVLVIALASRYAWSLVWASDDAYIAYRYATNFAHGDGLVFNLGERVEGYTDFLWTVIVAGTIKLGFDPGQAGIVLSLASFVALLVIAHRLAETLSPRAGVVIGLGPLLIGFNYTLASFATSGLETVFAAMLTLLSVERAEGKKPFAAGLAGIGATLAHPDHAVFYAALAAALLVTRERRRELVPYLAPFVLVFVPYFAWRYSYYGDLFPNTYYAKSGMKTYFSQGSVYFFTTYVGAGLFWAVPLAVAGMLGRFRTVSARFALIGLPAYTFYVIKVGGDFMLGRLFAPVLAIVFVFADVGFRELLARRRVVLGTVFGTLATIAAFPLSVVQPGELFFGIADERSFTPITSFATMESPAAGYALGKALHRSLKDRGLQPLVGVFSLGMSAYYSELPVFDLRGLTTPSVAHLPIKGRGRPGHEKTASPGLMMAAHVELSEMSFYPPPYDALTGAHVGSTQFFFSRWDAPLIERLSPRERPPDYVAFLDGLETTIARDGLERMACDLWHARQYYFSQYDDPSRRAKLEKAAAVADPALDGAESLLLESRDPKALGYTPRQRFSFEASDVPWSLSGGAEAWSGSALLFAQEAPFGNVGQFMNTFSSSRNDAAMGRAVSPSFVIGGDVLTLLVSGGFDAARLHVTLEVDGTPVRSATGCSSEIFSRRVWNIAPFVGMTARVVVTDQADGGWGHLAVDEITEWKRP